MVQSKGLASLLLRGGKSGGVTARQFGGEGKSCTFVVAAASPPPSPSRRTLCASGRDVATEM